MFNNIVTYHVHRCNPLAASDALAYQYILAGNGIFIRAETHFFSALIPITVCSVRGRAPLRPEFRLKDPPIPEKLLRAALTEARPARRPGGGLNEVLYQCHHQGHTVQLRRPPQRATAASVVAAGDSDSTVLCELHSHGNVKAFWSRACWSRS